MFKRKYIFHMLCGLLAAALLVSGCSSPTGTPDPVSSAPLTQATASPFPSGGTVKIGAILPLNTQSGQESKNGLEFAVNEINSAGGILALGGSKIELLVGDSASSPTTAAAEAARLTQTEQVSVLISADLSPSAQPAAVQANKMDIPLILTAASADTLVPTGQNNIFRLNPSASQQAQSMAAFIKEVATNGGLPITKAALISEPNGETDPETLKAALAGVGVQTSLNLQINDQAAAAVAIDQIQAVGVDLVIYLGAVDRFQDFSEASAAVGLTIPVLVNPVPFYTPADLQKLFGPTLDGWFSTGQFSQNFSVLTSLAIRFQSKYSHPFSDASLYAYQAGWLIASALEASIPANSAGLQTALANTGLDAGPRMLLPETRLAFDTQGQNKEAPVFFFQIQAGSPVLVWPRAYGAQPILTDR